MDTEHIIFVARMDKICKQNNHIANCSFLPLWSMSNNLSQLRGQNYAGVMNWSRIGILAKHVQFLPRQLESAVS